MGNETEMREIFTELSPENQEDLLARAMQSCARQEKAGREGDFACRGNAAAFAGARGGSAMRLVDTKQGLDLRFFL